MKRLNSIQTKDYIANLIRNEILAGRMKSGEELTQEVLADTLGVSRMPIREALQTLAQEGFVERLPNRHIQVVALERSQISETFCTIAAIEAQISELVIVKGTSLEAVTKVRGAVAEAVDSDGLIEAEVGFHYQLVSLLDNKYLAQIHDKLMRGYVTYAIEHLGEVNERKEHLLKVIEQLEKKQINQLKTAFEEYYSYYADQFE